MILNWDIYEIKSNETLHGIKLRGHIRKFSIENDIICLVENASDEENVVRFAIPTSSNTQKINDFVKTLLKDTVITKVLESV